MVAGAVAGRFVRAAEKRASSMGRASERGDGARVCLVVVGGEIPGRGAATERVRGLHAYLPATEYDLSSGESTR